MSIGSHYPPHLDRLAAELVTTTAADLTDHLRRWSCPEPDLRARRVVAIAVRLLHDVLLQRSRRTTALRAEVTGMLGAYLTAS